MGVRVRKTLTLMLGGTSLTAGRLTTPPIPWTYYLAEDMRASEFCQGPVRIINTGKGSQTSNFGATEAARMAPLRPDFVLMEDFAINDCAIGPVSISQATANFNSMVASYRAANPEVVIVHQTMSSASAGDASRTNLAAYYDNGLANAALNGLESLDNYYGTALVPGGWPKPLPVNLTVPAAASYLAWGLGTTWSPGDKSGNVNLSGANLAMTVPGASYGAVRGTVGHASGLWSFGVQVVVGAGAFQIGVGTTSATLTDYVGSDANAISYTAAGSIITNGAIVGTGDALVTGDLVTVALDNDAGRIWFAKNGVWQNGDPSSQSGGAAITPALARYPMASARDGGGCTADFTVEVSGGDGLHPIWPAAFQTFSYPNILAWAGRAMADFWT